MRKPYQREDRTALAEWGSCGSDAADGAGNRGRPAPQARVTGENSGKLPEPQTSISFPEIWYPRPGKGRKEGLRVFVGILRDFEVLMKTLSHYS